MHFSAGFFPSGVTHFEKHLSSIAAFFSLLQVHETEDFFVTEGLCWEEKTNQSQGMQSKPKVPIPLLTICVVKDSKGFLAIE